MAHSRSAKKRHRQNEKRRVTNRATKASLKTFTRRVREAVESGKLDVAEAELKTTATRLDRAAAKRIIHPNAAARTKSRLSHLIKSKKSPAPAAAK